MRGGDTRDIWRVSTNPTFPLFTCRASGSEISIYLKLKNGVSHLRDSQQIEFWGDENTREGAAGLINLSDISTSNQKTYKLTVFDPSGNSRLEVGTDSSSSLYETLTCKPLVFKVTEGQAQAISSSSSKGVSKELKNIPLTLENCDTNDSRKPCSIKIGGDVGLSWRDDFIPKVFL
ncbi:hypothetical protein WEN_01655 [Mycoplasma wenyonii str. Massachusetts]|uniref:Uncharacterized protein n=1 Tax=Mycoplasma wenyonii (strain Massachusetts) TaxID=1197325 RepID=I6YLF0_MYCWM|nr:hypothetical protein [Mycoplasma wenyonii]AFN65124.1 hypothetical protein WEN_01655 [Mycoplasma wenyonii str. Massachusetts]